MIGQSIPTFLKKKQENILEKLVITLLCTEANFVSLIPKENYYRCRLLGMNGKTKKKESN